MVHSSQNGRIPHAICVPFPGQGHITPMLKLAKLLHQQGFHITFVNTEFSHRRLLLSRGSSAFESLTSRFRFETIPDGLPPSEEDPTTQDVASVCESTRRTCIGPFRRLVSKLNGAATLWPRVSCIVSDCMMGFTMEVAKELGIPNVTFVTSSACGFMGYLSYRQLLERGIVPLKDASYLTNGYLDTRIDWIPGMEGIPLKYMPSLLRTTDPNDFMFNFAMAEVENTRNASAIVFNTFDKLEREFVESLSPTTFPPIYTIGPLHLMDPRDGTLDSLGSNLWKEDSGCIEWLDRKEPNSVVYVNFGSVAVMTSHQLVEFAWGLGNSGKPFLWVIRPDLIRGETAVLPVEFMDEIKERGLMVSWCPQEKVLKHPSIGGFLTHCGWNSTLESLTSGVPMICWPFFAEQQTNCWFVCEKLGVGLEIDNDVKRSEIDELVRELMDGEKGKEMKQRAMEWKKSAEDATRGDSRLAYLNLEDMINKILLDKDGK